jgi:hypothetical protein
LRNVYHLRLQYFVWAGEARYFDDAKAEASPSLVFTSQLYDKYPGGIREWSPRVEVKGGAGSPLARSAVPSSMLLGCA